MASMIKSNVNVGADLGILSRMHAGHDLEQFKKKTQAEADILDKSQKERDERVHKLQMEAYENMQAIGERYAKNRAGSRIRWAATHQAMKAVTDTMASIAMMDALQTISKSGDKSDAALQALLDSLKPDNINKRNATKRLIGSMGGGSAGLNTYYERVLRNDPDEDVQAIEGGIARRSSKISMKTPGTTTVKQGDTLGESLVRTFTGLGAAMTGQEPPGIASDEQLIVDEEQHAKLRSLDLAPEIDNEKIRQGQSKELKKILGFYGPSMHGLIDAVVSGKGEAEIAQAIDKIPGETVQEARMVFQALAEQLDWTAAVTRGGAGNGERMAAVARQLFGDDKEAIAALSDITKAKALADGMSSDRKETAASNFNLMAGVLREVGTALNRPVRQDIQQRLMRFASAHQVQDAKNMGTAAQMRVLGNRAALSLAQANTRWSMLGGKADEAIRYVNSYQNKDGFPNQFVRGVADGIKRLAKTTGENLPDTVGGIKMTDGYAMANMRGNPNALNDMAQTIEDVDLGEAVTPASARSRQQYKMIVDNVRSGNLEALQQMDEAMFDKSTNTAFEVLEQTDTAGKKSFSRGKPLYDPSSPDQSDALPYAQELISDLDDNSLETDVQQMFGSRNDMMGTVMQVMDTDDERDDAWMESVIPKASVPDPSAMGYGAGDSIGPGYDRYNSEKMRSTLDEMKRADDESRASLSMGMGGGGQQGQTTNNIKMTPTARPQQGGSQQSQQPQPQPQKPQGPALSSIMNRDRGSATPPRIA